MSEHATIHNPAAAPSQDLQQTPDPNIPIQDDMSIREFMALLRKNGLDEDAQLMNEMFNNMSMMDSQFHNMREQLQELQSEVERLRGDTPLTDQFKKEFCTRSTQMRQHLEDLADRFVDAKHSFIESAKEGIQKFAILGKSALHKACVSMCDAGINYFRRGIDYANHAKQNYTDIIDRLDTLKESAAQTRQTRSNLVRAMLGLKTDAKLKPKESLVLTSVRQTAELHRNINEKNVFIGYKIINKLENYRSKHLEAFDKNPSFDTLLKNAQKKAEQLQNTMKDKFKDRGPTGPTR